MGAVDDCWEKGCTDRVRMAKANQTAVLWILAFLRQRKGTICRTYTRESFLEDDVEIQIVTDASPWRLGAVLVVHGNAQAYFAVPLTTDDEEQLSIQIGEAAGQQVAEALRVLVTLRQWTSVRKLSRCAFDVRSDSVSALSLLSYCRVRGATVAKIAHEVALDFAEGVYRPKVSTHVPGVLNASADSLSRWYVPSGK